MHDRSKWIRFQSGDFRIGVRDYKNLVEFRRPCEACGELFSIFVTEKIAEGRADSNSFGLKNCEQHRRSKLGSADAETRTANVTMKEELAGLYVRNKELFEEVQVLKAKLAKYEAPTLTEAMSDLWQSQKVTTTNGALPDKMPWE